MVGKSRFISSFRWLKEEIFFELLVDTETVMGRCLWDK